MKHQWPWNDNHWKYQWKINEHQLKLDEAQCSSMQLNTPAQTASLGETARRAKRAPSASRTLLLCDGSVSHVLLVTDWFRNEEPLCSAGVCCAAFRSWLSLKRAPVLCQAGFGIWLKTLTETGLPPIDPIRFEAMRCDSDFDFEFDLRWHLPIPFPISMRPISISIWNASV